VQDSLSFIVNKVGVRSFEKFINRKIAAELKEKEQKEKKTRTKRKEDTRSQRKELCVRECHL